MRMLLQWEMLRPNPGIAGQLRLSFSVICRVPEPVRSDERATRTRHDTAGAGRKDERRPPDQPLVSPHPHTVAPTRRLTGVGIDREAARRRPVLAEEPRHGGSQSPASRRRRAEGRDQPVELTIVPRAFPLVVGAGRFDSGRPFAGTWKPAPGQGAALRADAAAPATAAAGAGRQTVERLAGRDAAAEAVDVDDP